MAPTTDANRAADSDTEPLTADPRTDTGPEPISGSTIHMTGPLSPRSGWTAGGNCPIARTFEVLSTKTAYLLLREAFYGATRFEEFVERAEVSEPVAAARLKELVDAGMLERVPYREPGKRTRNGYRLTAKGRDFQPVLVTMMEWGDRWLFEHGAGARLTHSDCGAPIHTHLTCDAGHEVRSGEADLTLRPRASRTASGPDGKGRRGTQPAANRPDAG